MRRRYSDFYSLRQTLVSLHPTLIVPPIPEKHSVADYAAKPTKAKEDEAIIDHRKRMLSSFLNRCRRMREIREDDVFWKFLDPHASWVSARTIYRTSLLLTCHTHRAKFSTHLQSRLCRRTISKLLQWILLIQALATTTCQYPLRLRS